LVIAGNVSGALRQFKGVTRRVILRSEATRRVILRSEATTRVILRSEATTHVILRSEATKGSLSVQGFYSRGEKAILSALRASG